MTSTTSTRTRPPAGISLTALRRRGWLLELDDPVPIVHRGRVLGILSPMSDVAPIDPLDHDRAPVVPYQLANDIRVDLLRALTDAAALAVELRPADCRRIATWHAREDG